MIPLRVVLIGISLLVITFVHYGSTNEVCENFITQEEMFVKGYENVLWNYTNAFKYLTTSKLSNKFKIKKNNSNAVKILKRLRRKLIFDYFWDLYNGRKKNLDQMDHHFRWCEKMVNNDAALGIIKSDGAWQDEFHTAGYFFGNGYAINKKVIHRVLYKEWSYDRIHAKIDELKNEIPEGLEDPDQIAIWYKNQNMQIAAKEKYSLGYFHHVATYNDLPGTIHGRIRSIEDFCNEYKPEENESDENDEE